MLVKLFKSLERYDGLDHKHWGGIIEGLREQGYKVHGVPEQADVSIVLGGKMENPLCFSGKRVIVFYPPEWVPFPYGGQLFGQIIQHYYHDHINLGNEDDIGLKTRVILEYIKKAENVDTRK